MMFEFKDVERVDGEKVMKLVLYDVEEEQEEV